MMKRIFSFLICFSLLSMRSVCACESTQIDQTVDYHHTQEDEGCHGHEVHGDQSSKPSHHACICPDHGDEAALSDVHQLVVPSVAIAEVNWSFVDLFPIRHATDLLVYYHSPPASRPLYLTQSSLLL